MHPSRLVGLPIVSLLAALFPLSVVGAGPSASPVPAPSGAGAMSMEAPMPLTARMLTAPGALMGPLPTSLAWSPVGEALAYVYPRDGKDVLWLHDAAAGTTRLLFDPAAGPDPTIDLASAQWSPSGDALLLSGGTSLWLLDATSGDLRAVAPDDRARTGVLFLPDGRHVSYVADQDLYVASLDGGPPQRLTHDGSETIINGGLDWVYNEELATRAAQPAYAWSPDGKRIVWLRLDDGEVQSHPVTDYRPVPPTVTWTRYPVTGTANPKASVHALALDDDAPAATIVLPADAEYVLPWFTWTPDGREALFATVSRDHRSLRLSAWDPSSGATREVLAESDPDWINEDRYAAPVFLGDGGSFLWLSERDGFMHLYLYETDGTLVRQVTQGDWMIDSSAWDLLVAGRPVQVDATGTWAWFIATKDSPLERQVYRVDIATGELQRLSGEAGWHAMALSTDGGYLVDQWSDVETPPVTQVLRGDGTGASVLDRAAGPSLALPAVSREFMTLTAHDGTELYAQLVKPEGFDPAKHYPVVVHWYGGPGLQMVSNRYGATNIFNIIERDVLYTQAGFLVWRLDDRGSSGRGHAFETPIAGHLGPAALDDQLAGIELLRTLPWVDAGRIGTDGKSFGGYLTLYALTHAPDVFRCGVAGAPPTDWRLYDTIYTERYMGTPQSNPDGYAATDLVATAATLRAAPLLIHGLADRNVHLQNTIDLIEALEAADRPFEFLPLPNLDHSFKGDGLVAALSASTDYLGRCLAPGG